MKLLEKLNTKLNTFLTGTAPVITGENVVPKIIPHTRQDEETTPQVNMDGPWPLNKTLLRFSTLDAKKADARIPFTLANSYEGTFVFGSVGSGKTSGTGRMFAASFLRAGFGGLVMCVKADEAEAWVRYAEENGRADDLVVFSEKNKNGFNFLKYELEHAMGNPAEAATGVLMELVGAASMGSDNKIWEKASRRLIRSGLLACQLAGEEPTIALLYQIASNKTTAKAILDKAVARGEAGQLNESELSDYAVVLGYFGTEWQQMANETRGSIMMNMTSLCDPFLSGVIRDMFTQKTTVSPDDIFAGKVVVVDLPTLRYYEAGRVSQVAWKYCFQRAVQRRIVNDTTRPTFIYADECHAVVTDTDGDFVTTSRSSRCATVFLTQNRPNLLARMSKERVDSMLGCFQSKIWHQQADPETNNWAADVIAKTYQTKASTSTNYQAGGEPGQGASGGTSYQQSLEHQLLPVEFLRLAKGGADFQLIVTAYLFMSGKVFASSGNSFALVGFRQGVPVSV